MTTAEDCEELILLDVDILTIWYLQWDDEG